MFEYSNYTNNISIYSKESSNYQAALLNKTSSDPGIIEIRFGLASDDLYIASTIGIHIYKHSDQSYTHIFSKADTFVLGISND